ncbi:MAG: TonB-dependent receptor domain-containing protein [Janthinobacterium lividum]
MNQRKKGDSGVATASHHLHNPEGNPAAKLVAACDQPTGRRQYGRASKYFFPLRFTQLLALPALIIGSCLGAGVARAQLSTADIVGTVTDATGAVVPGAKVTLVNNGTHETRNTTTSNGGDYDFTLLPVGTYTITVDLTGFKADTITNIAVEAGDRAREDAKLQTGSISETVSVEAQTPLLQADNATVSSTVTAKAVQDLPLNGRNFVQLVQLVPGANEGPGNGLTSGGRPDDRRSTSGFSVNGQDNVLNDYTIDGIDDNERIIGAIGVRPDVEGINEITVQTNSYAPEAGRTAGGVVSIITRSGTNTFHGSAYEFFRNDLFDARNVLQTTGRKPELRQNQFGGSIGGPIFKDRTFFFADYEGFRLVSGQTDTSTVPDISEYNAINSIGGASPAQLVAAGNGTAGHTIDPIALAYLKLFPAPTNSSPTNNYIISPSTTQSSNTYDVRVDHKFNSNNLLFARYDYNKVDSFIPPALGVVNGLQISGGRYNFDGPATDYASQLGIGFTHIFTPRLLVDLRAAYTRINNLSLPLNYGLNADTTVGFGSNMNFSAQSNELTPISFGPFSDIGDGAYVPLQDIDNTFQYSGVVSYTIGNHQIRAGASLIRRQARNLQSAAPAGDYSFGLSSDNVAGNVQKTDDNILASSLIGAFNGDGRNYDINTPDYRTWEPNGFAQDSWKVTPKLTVLYGGRYDVFTPFTEAHNHISNFDAFEARTLTATNIGNALQVANVNGVDGHAGIKVDYTNVAPRVGFAYSVTPTIVVRGGYGLSYFPGNYTSNFNLKNAPFVSVFSPSCTSVLGFNIETAPTTMNHTTAASINPACGTPNTPGAAAPTTFDVGLPLPAPQTLSSSGLSFSSEDPKFRSSVIQQYNLQIEQQFGANVLTLGYVGNKGSHIPQTINDVNSPLPFVPGTLNAAGQPAQTRPLATILPNLSGVSWGASEGISNYNALQTSLQRRFSKGLAFDGNYTWAKAMSNTVGFSEEGDQGAYNADPYNTHVDYGVAENDIQNRFALSVNYEFQYGKSWHGIEKQALAGWQVNSIVVWQSGKPITIVNGGSGGTTSDIGGEGGTTVYGNRATPVNSGGSDRPNMVADGRGPRKLTEWFNTAAFQPQPLGTIGNEVRNSLFGPRFRHVDLSLFKDFPVTERVNLQFRAEAFDLSNTPNYYIPNNNPGNLQLGNSTFGTVTTYDPNYTPREIQFALKATF